MLCEKDGQSAAGFMGKLLIEEDSSFLFFFFFNVILDVVEKYTEGCVSSLTSPRWWRASFLGVSREHALRDIVVSTVTVGIANLNDSIILFAGASGDVALGQSESM